MAVYILSRHKSRSGGGGGVGGGRGGGGGGGGRGARLNLMVRISLLAHKFRGETQKEGLQRKIWAQSSRSLVFFFQEQNFTHAFGGPILMEHRPQNALQWPRNHYFLLGHNPRLGGTLLLEGSASSDLGSTAPNASRGAGLTRNPPEKNILPPA